MEFYNNLSILKKIMSGFIIIALISGIIGAFSTYQIIKTSNGTQELYLKNTVPLDSIGKVGILVQKLRIATRELHLKPDLAGKQKAIEDIAAIFADIESKLAIYEKTINDKKIREDFDDIKRDLNNYKPVMNKFAELALAGKSDEYLAMLYATGKDSAISKVTEINDQVTALSKRTIELATIEYDKSVQNSRFTIVMAAIFTVVNIFSALLIGYFLAYTIKKPINNMKDILRDIAEGEGDLVKRLSANSKDEIGQTCHWFNTFIDKLHGIISNVSINTVQVASASVQLQTTAEGIANGSDSVANQTTSVATATEQMSATSTDISNNCHRAADGAKRASDIVTEGSRIVEHTLLNVEAVADNVKLSSGIINKLGESSLQIGEIINTITDIADRTNLLALNAAIEAARAGDNGRGFAVVADEVRNLATQTTSAAKSVGDMIKSIQRDTGLAVESMELGVKKVEAVSVDAEKSREALNRIAEQIESLNVQVNQIATAAEEQTATTHGISRNLMEITDVVHKTASGSQETATAAIQLAGFAEQLQSFVCQFKLA